MNRVVEILAPAGSMECLQAAIAAGADAVYLGGTRFGARAYAQNLSEEDMVQAIEYVHIHRRKIYMTVNTLLKDREMEELYAYLLPYYRAGLDGVIVQDIGAVKYIREHFPKMPVHASTQMTITNTLGAEHLKQYGITRVVPARELSLGEIRDMKRQTGLEMECFVHGALCYCYSGQCLLSSMIGGRSGNRGQCAQPCRLPYQIDGKKPADLMSLKDLCTIDILPELIDAGVDSFKIEGRMKSPRYTAGVVRIYRKYLDRYLEYGSERYYVEPEDKKELLDLFDRGGFTSGYYTRHNGRDMIALKEKPEFRETNKELFDFLDREYVVKEGKNLRPTPLGEVVTGLMKDKFTDIVDTAFTATMEERLDEVETGKVDWKSLLGDFYGDFEQELQKAEADLDGERIKVPDEVSEEICPQCGRNLVIKSGRFGRFLACPGWPECDFTMPLVVEMPGKCPKCGGRLLKRTGKSKKTGKQYTYYCCEHLNSKDESRRCDFMTWDVPVKDNCPVCGWTMFKKSGRGFKKPFCINEQCSNFTPEEKRGGWKKKTEEADAPAQEGEESAKKPVAKKSTAAKKTTKKADSTKKSAKTTTKKTSTKKTTKTAAKKAKLEEAEA